MVPAGRCQHRGLRVATDDQEKVAGARHGASDRSTDARRDVARAAPRALPTGQITAHVPVWKGQHERGSTALTADGSRAYGLSTPGACVCPSVVQARPRLGVANPDGKSLVTREACVVTLHRTRSIRRHSVSFSASLAPLGDACPACVAWRFDSMQTCTAQRAVRLPRWCRGRPPVTRPRRTVATPAPSRPAAPPPTSSAIRRSRS